MKNEFPVTRKLCHTWLWENMRKPPQIFICIFWVAFSLVITGVCITMQMNFLFIFAVFCIYRAFFRNLLFTKRRYDLLAKGYGGENWIRTVSFEENEIVTTEGGSKGTVSHQVPYSEIVRIEEKGNSVWLILKDKKVIRIYKDKFTDTSWEECQLFLKGKMTP